jgi:hypothetical protein
VVVKRGSSASPSPTIGVRHPRWPRRRGSSSRWPQPTEPLLLLLLLRLEASTLKLPLLVAAPLKLPLLEPAPLRLKPTAMLLEATMLMEATKLLEVARFLAPPTTSLQAPLFVLQAQLLGLDVIGALGRLGNFPDI